MVAGKQTERWPRGYPFGNDSVLVLRRDSSRHQIHHRKERQGRKPPEKVVAVQSSPRPPTGAVPSPSVACRAAKPAARRVPGRPVRSMNLELRDEQKV